MVFKSNSLGNTVVILVTGSLGLVGTHLVRELRKKGIEFFGIDLEPADGAHYASDISSPQWLKWIDKSQDYIIVNLAAARFDFGANADDYWEQNVTCHEGFLSNLENINVSHFIHISSVASFDGKTLEYSEVMNCDDAYRTTKYRQEVVIEEWCVAHDIPVSILYPSAIFSDDERTDTNIGKMQSLSRMLPFVPKIDVVKSLTYLPHFNSFIIDLINDKLAPGHYLTIEKPLLEVSKMIQIVSDKRLTVVRIPWLRGILMSVSWFLYILGGFGKIDMKLTPNRVVKLFSETSYSHIKSVLVDATAYSSSNSEPLTRLLSRFKKN